MIRDNVQKNARWCIPPENDEIATQRVADLVGRDLKGLEWTVYKDIPQLVRALEEAGYRKVDEKLLVSGGMWNKLFKVSFVSKGHSKWNLWLFQTFELKVLIAELVSIGEDITALHKKENDDVLGE
jgi:hypothetical protein